MTVSLSLLSGLNNNIPRITEIAISVICVGIGGAKIITDLVYFCQENATVNVKSKVGCVFSMVDLFIRSNAEFGPNDHQEDAPRFTKLTFNVSIFDKLGQDISTKRHLSSQHCIENNSAWPGINPPRIVGASSHQYFGCSVNCGATECRWEGILFHRTRKTEIAKLQNSIVANKAVLAKNRSYFQIFWVGSGTIWYRDERDC